MRLARCQVKEFDRAKLFYDDCPGPGRGALEVEAVAVQRLAHGAGPGVELEQAYRPISIRQEIHRITNPERVMVVRVLARYGSDARVAEVHDPDRSGLTAAITLPCLLPLTVRDIGELAAVRRQRCFLGGGDRQLLGNCGIGADRVELPFVVVEAVGRAGEQYAFAVWGPTADQFFRRMRR